MRKIELSHEVQVAIAACVGEGAVEYWARTSWFDDETPSLTLTYHDPATDALCQSDIDRDMLNAGANIILNTPHFADGIPYLSKALSNEDYIDWPCADAVIQASIFGEIVFS